MTSNNRTLIVLRRSADYKIDNSVALIYLLTYLPTYLLTYLFIHSLIYLTLKVDLHLAYKKPINVSNKTAQISVINFLITVIKKLNTYSSHKINMLQIDFTSHNLHGFQYIFTSLFLFESFYHNFLIVSGTSDNFFGTR